MNSLKLISLFLEQVADQKVLIMAGGGGAGKSWILDQIDTKDLPILNPDTYVEKDGIPLAAASSMVNKEVERLSSEGKPFIWDTTASKPEKVQNLIDQNYEVLMVMVYTHPFISFLSNYQRERKLPKSAIFSTWTNAYGLIQEYQKMLGDNFLLYVNMRGGQFNKEVEEFDKAVQKGPRAVKTFLDDLISKDPEHFSSTFSKPFSIEDPQAKEQFNTEIQNLDIDTEDESMMKQLKRHFMKKWDKDGIGPGEKSMETKRKAILRSRDRRDSRYLSDIENMVKKLTSPKFRELLQSESIGNVKSKVNQFLK